jgi:hypothetical protein
VLDYFIGGEVVEPPVVHDAFLFFLHFHTGSFGARRQGKMLPLFSFWHDIGRLSMG